MTADASLSGLSMSDAPPVDPAGSAETSSTGQYVSFTIGERTYCVDIMSVRKIKAWSTTTMLPNAPDYVRGVLNLRGTIVPIHDLRIRFGEGITETTEHHVILIVAVAEKIAGLLVDTVSDILTVGNDQVKPVPLSSSTSGANYLTGLISVDSVLTAVLDLERLFEGTEVSTTSQY